MSASIRGLLLLLSTLLMSSVFLLTKNGDYQSVYPYFPFNPDVSLARDTYVYFLFERLILIVMSLYIYMESHKHRVALLVFVVIQVLDGVDYVLTYNMTWKLGWMLLSWDIMKIAIFTLAIINEVLKEIEMKTQGQ